FEDRDHISFCRRYRYALDKGVFRKMISAARPILDPARTGVIRGQRHCRLGWLVAILFAKLFQIPAADLDISFGIAKKFDNVVRGLLLVFPKSGLVRPVAGH